MSAAEQLAMLEQASQQRRRDLQSIWDAHIGALSASILAFEAAGFGLATDPTMPVLVDEESEVLGGNNNVPAD